MMPLQLQISLRSPQPTNTPERDFALWIVAAKVPFYQLQGPLFMNFLHAVPKLPSGFNPREVMVAYEVS